MTLMQEISKSIFQFVTQNNNWDTVSVSPISIVRVGADAVFPYVLDVVEGDEYASLRLQLKAEGVLSRVTQGIVAKRGGERYFETEGLFSTQIDEESFSISCNVNRDILEQFTENFDAIVERCEQMISALVKQSIELMQEEIEEDETGSAEEAPAPDVSSQALPEGQSNASMKPHSVKEAIIQYLDRKEWNYEDDEEKGRILLRVKLSQYSDHDDSNVFVVDMNYGNDDLVRFQSPMMYKFDLSVTPYSLIASVIAWCQFQYKFLSMSLDPADGELKISIDIPLGKGSIDSSQVERIVGFMVQFTEETFDEWFDDLLHSPQDAQKKLDDTINKHRQQFESKRWVHQFESDLAGLSESKRNELERVLAELKASDEASGNEGAKPREGI
ncbi:hypothetical protein [Marinomonas algarum]|uniref:YbjN domain-containing protein n=1 Tax=Marinomonas algarum TaxID=2883105 RepID=A0A9X1IM12_9GAMM|nr:hypothetical protein [Marinomonas algarum]MCB5161949.1 hypothetical protein [Marinomonas algarum]